MKGVKMKKRFTKVLNATLTDDLYYLLKEEAEKESASASFVLRKILKEYFSKKGKVKVK
jgi:hypothetical protein